MKPNGRGTWSLILSCVLTMSLCVYTALHPNIFSTNTTRGVRFILNLRWVLLGIVAPELFAYTGWKQWDSARKLTLEVNRMLENEAGNSSSTSQ
jgi:hypothetical protein